MLNLRSISWTLRNSWEKYSVFCGGNCFGRVSYIRTVCEGLHDRSVSQSISTFITQQLLNFFSTRHVCQVPGSIFCLFSKKYTSTYSVFVFVFLCVFCVHNHIRYCTGRNCTFANTEEPCKDTDFPQLIVLVDFKAIYPGVPPGIFASFPGVAHFLSFEQICQYPRVSRKSTGYPGVP